MSDDETVNHDKTALKTMHDIVDLLINDDARNIKSTIAYLPYLTVAQEKILASDDNIYIRAAMASNRNNDPQTYIDLFFNEEEENVDNSPPRVNVYVDLARNPSCPEQILRELIKHVDNPKIASSLVENPSTPNDLILELAKHTDSKVREETLKVIIQRVENVVKKHEQ